MATLSFPKLLFKKEDIAFLLSGKKEANGFKRICIQTYRQKDDSFTLVGQALGRNRKKLEKCKIILIEAHPVKNEKKEDILKTDDELIFLQHDLTIRQLAKMSDNGKKDVVLVPQFIIINPTALTYSSDSGDSLNPCPPNQPG